MEPSLTKSFSPFSLRRSFVEARRVCRDCYAGTDAIKRGPFATSYLPCSEREANEEEKFSADAKKRTRYRTRRDYGVYENFFKTTIDDVVGIMQRNPANVQFGEDGDDHQSPREVRDLAVYGNAQNDGLVGLKQRVNFGQTLYGRYGLLLDVVPGKDGLEPKFSISEYVADSILDGDTVASRFGASRLRWVLLDESAYRFNAVAKRWDFVESFRVLGLDSKGRYYQAVLDGDAGAKWADFCFGEPNADSVVYPLFKGKTLDFIPFTVANVDRIGLDAWQAPPFLDVARVAIANYQIDSLYKTALWNFASPTLVIKNSTEGKEQTYLGDALFVNSDAGAQADASLLETSGSGMAELRSAKTEIKSALKFTSIRDLLDAAGANASERALSLRADSGTATVATLDKTGARAIEEQLVFAAVWAGATFAEAGRRIKYAANCSYLANDCQLSSVVQLMTANASTGEKFLSNRQLYRLIDSAVGSKLDDFDDNEKQKLTEDSTL